MNWFDELLKGVSKGMGIVLAVGFGVASLGSMFLAWITALIGLGILNAICLIGWILNALMSVYIIVKLSDGYFG